MRTARRTLGTAGVLLMAVGCYLLLTRQDLADLADVALWLAAGVVVHDLLLAPVVVALGVLGARLLPAYVRGPAAAGAVVLGTVTLAAVPVLGRFGAEPANPTLLDRDYVAGWLLLAGLTLLGVVLGAVVGAVREGPRHADPPPEDRTPVR